MIGVGWVAEAKGEFFHTLEQISSHCMFIEIHKQPQLQFTCQADKVADSSLTPSVA